MQKNHPCSCHGRVDEKAICTQSQKTAPVVSVIKIYFANRGIEMLSLSIRQLLDYQYIYRQ